MQFLLVFSPAVLSALALFILLATSGLPGRFPPEAQPYIAVLSEAEESALEGAACQINRLNRDSVERVKRGDLCTFGKAEAPGPVFLAWGDSHAYQFAPLFGKIADDLSVQGLFLPTPGHPPLLGTYRHPYDTESEKAALMEMTSAAVDLIREKNISVVVLCSFWLAQPYERDLMAMTPDGKVVKGFDAIAQGLRNTIPALEETGCELWLLRTIPFYPASVPRMMMRALRSGKNPRELYVRLADYESMNSKVSALFDDIASRHPGVRFIDPVPVLCPDGETCLPAVDNQPLYFDDNHLSKFGALYLEPAFADFAKSLARHKQAVSVQ